ncbi:MAG: lycopene cyclase domain-containing protein [Gemmatimonadota bacterium]
MTYAQFHVLFVLPPVLLLATGVGRSAQVLGRRAGLALLAVPMIALVYTTPWDAYLIGRGVWSYGPDRVLGALWGVPFEEIAFFVLQPVLTGMVFFRFLGRLLTVEPAPRLERPARTVRLAGVLVALVWLLLGLALLQREEGTYLGLILVWAVPVLGALWAYRGDLIWRWKAAVLPGVAVPTLWFWVADRIALRDGVWRISERFTLGWNPLDLPVEEATFFLVTNLLVVFGLVLFLEPGLRGGNSDTLPQPVQDES